MIKKAKEDDVNITCDVTPHHLFFNDSCLTDFNTNFKVKPPIRSEEDREAIIDGIKEGVIDVVASDHAPHLETEKNTTFKEASFGAIGLETLFSACYTKLYKQEGIKLPDVISLFTSSPLNILDIESGSLKIGNKADITIFNPDKINKIRKKDFISKSVNSPFIGESLFGEVVYTINNGKLVFKSG
jgi:dihydroorotase